MRKMICLIGLFFLFTPSLFAFEYESQEHIADVVKTYVEQLNAETQGEITVEVKPLDARLKLGACSQTLEPFLPPGANGNKTSTIGVRCKGDKPWTIYVPVDIHMYQMILVATHPIPKGTLINDSDMRLNKQDTQQLFQGYFADPTRVTGQLASKFIVTDEPFCPKNTELPKIIEKGQEVTIIAKTGALEVSMKGIAMETGTLGQRISVKNLSSSKIIEAVITSKSQVQVSL